MKPLSKRGFGRINWIAAVYRFIVGGLITSQERIVFISDYKLLVSLGKKHDIGSVAQMLIYDGEYEPQTSALFKRLLKPNMKVVDVGANIGYYTVLASKLVGLGGRVWAFEPAQGNYADLLKNIKLNSLENIVAIQKAVSDRKGIAEFYISESQPDQHSLVPNWAKGKNNVIEVKTDTLDNMVKEEVDLIKTDTEGNELAVLNGAKRLLRSKDIKLLVECSPQRVGMGGYTVVDVWELLVESGFQYIYLVNERENKVVLTNCEELVKFSFAGNVLCSKMPIMEL